MHTGEVGGGATQRADMPIPIDQLAEAESADLNSGMQQVSDAKEETEDAVESEETEVAAEDVVEDVAEDAVGL